MRIAPLALVFVLAACVPKKDLPPDQITKLTKLDDVMDVQATIADPQFKKAGQGSYSDAEFAAFADMGARLQTTALKAKEFTKGAGFDELANQLASQARSLADAAAAKDAGAAAKALTDMKATCKTCHQKFK